MFKTLKCPILYDDGQNIARSVNLDCFGHHGVHRRQHDFAARAAMAKQTGLDKKTVLNVRPAFLIVPASLELTAEQMVAQNLVSAATPNVVPQVKLPKRLDLDRDADRALDSIPGLIVANWVEDRF